MARRFLVLLAGVTVALAPALVAGAPTGYAAWLVVTDGWEDQHAGYPTSPSGVEAIRREFGSPCSSDSQANVFVFVAADDGKPYRVGFHRRLGGAASSNLDNDIPGHIERLRLSPSLKHGIWGYVCRFKRDADEYSTHAWGIAVDINSAHEVPGQDCRSIPEAMGAVWENHRWRWGADWKDCMHFQYASGY